MPKFQESVVNSNKFPGPRHLRQTRIIQVIYSPSKDGLLRNFNNGINRGPQAAVVGVNLQTAGVDSLSELADDPGRQVADREPENGYTDHDANGSLAALLLEDQDNQRRDEANKGGPRTTQQRCKRASDNRDNKPAAHSLATLKNQQSNTE